MTDSINAAIGFDALGLPENILSSLETLGFEQATAIQAQTIPHLLSGKDVLGEAQTGTGKTAAFGLPALSSVDVSVKKPQVLVLAPTRELAIQVSEAMQSFAKQIKGLRVATIYGGQSYGPQLGQLERGAQVVVGTPGRVMDHIRRKSLKLDNINFCVLDEADEMLNMGFLEDIEWILEHLSSDAQMALFSATMPKQIKKVADRFLKSPAHVKIAPVNKAKANIKQLAWKVSVINKLTALERIAETADYDAMIIFVRTRADTVEVAERLERQGFPALALNGDMNQAQRERTVDQIKSGKSSILIATDVVARGLDIPRIDLVINYDLPGDHESYVHRIGRTGRAGREGTAISFVRPREQYLLRHYEKLTAGKITPFELPTIQEIAASRIQKTHQTLLATIEKTDLEKMREIVANMAEKSETELLDLAAALLYQGQLKQPLQPKEDPKPRRERAERGERRGRERDERRGGERAPRKMRGQTQDVDFQQYRLEVGRSHGVKPGDIVGAIANEISLDSRYIGQIDLHERHSIVQLPKGMPEHLFKQLKKVRVRRQALEISVSQAPVIDQQAKRRKPKFSQKRH
ncbi:DEAD/DEAH box helicase [Thalassotalea agarivorans]|uniref:ATP-dependent RNA helicase DeaD n=1 Tax=Thalassotalea agarivorans TaxID=349064 RepID=A0A1I0FA71_THASX|nr:DEAD/DEAH box helicase [Thalassotalea agarivorans]SET55099.1 ATP-dependent RNA helicase CsdA [Thalassotalea agarivorans]